MIEVNVVQLDDRMTHVAIVGQVDVAGMHAIDVKFHGYTAARRKPAIVDLSAMDFISSLGMGMIVSCARSLQRAGAKMVLLNPQPEVEEALKAVGIDAGIPIVRSIEEGHRLLFPAAEPPSSS
jgi:anti-anti-sigma factor